MAKWNALVDAVRRSSLVSLVGGRMEQTTLGTMIAIDPGGGGDAVTEENYPWKPYVTEGVTIRLYPGSVGNVMPTNWNAELTLNANADHRCVYVEVSIDQQGNVTGAQIREAATVPTASTGNADGTIPGTLYALLFSYVSNDGAVSAFYVATKTNLAVSISATDPGCEAVYRRANLVSA